MDQRTGTWRPGAVVWREAATTDLAKTTAFYEELLGWTHKDSDMGPMGVYRHFQVKGQEMAGCYQMGEQMKGLPPHWMQYVSVPDVDAAAAKAKANGATLRMGPMDIPNVGRAVYLADPQGANVALFKDAKGDGPAPHPPFPVGAFCWETLNTSDKKGAVAFYTAVVGWKAGDFYGNVVFGTGDGPQDGVADLQDCPPGVPPSWLSHVVIEELGAARDRTTRLGGKVLMPEIVVPTVGRMAIVQDSVGAVISLYEPAPPA
jgi:predicted enzyme related to lactoylglutathione lyase